MMKKLKQFVLNIFLALGYRLVREERLQYYNLNLEGNEVKRLLRAYGGKSNEVLNLVHNYNGEFAQDLFVMLAFDFMKGGTFIEFGATDGLKGSNTYVLEKYLDWSGVLVEPIRSYFEDLVTNRPKSKCLNKVVSSSDGLSIGFKEYKTRSFSRIQSNNYDYMVETLTLHSLIEEHDLPQTIDFLSIDIEGHELTVLESFNWGGDYRFKIICIEHNHDENVRSKIKTTLEYSGYKRVFSKLSNVDDWYMSSDFIDVCGFSKTFSS